MNSLQESSFSNIFNKIICIFLKIALGSALNLVGISFHSFAPILEKGLPLNVRLVYKNEQNGV